MYKLIDYPGSDLKFNYYVNEYGSVWSGVTNKKMSYMHDKDGYLRVRLTLNNGKRRNIPVHRLVLMMHNPVDNMMELQVNHIDGNKHNNNLSNLEWVTSHENILHAVKIGLRNDKGECNYFHVLTEKKALEIKSLYSTGKYTQKQLGKMFGVQEETAGRIIRGKAWKHLS